MGGKGTVAAAAIAAVVLLLSAVPSATQYEPPIDAEAVRERQELLDSVLGKLPPADHAERRLRWNRPNWPRRPQDMHHIAHRIIAQQDFKSYSIEGTNLKLWESYKENRGKGFVSELTELFKSHNRDGTVLLLLFNKGHVHLFLNWACSAAQVVRGGLPAIAKYTVIITFDDDTVKAVNKAGFDGVLNAAAMFPAVQSTAAKAFGDQPFSKLMHAKTIIPYEAIKAGYSVFFQDVDVTWRGDPWLLFNHKTMQGADIIFSYDGGNPLQQPMYLNSGFMLARHTERVRWFYDELFKNVWRVVQGQQMLLELVGVHHYFTNNLRVEILSDEAVANGHLFSHQMNDPATGIRYFGKHRVPNTTLAVHASWTVNEADKPRKLALSGDWWYVPEREGAKWGRVCPLWDRTAHDLSTETRNFLERNVTAIMGLVSPHGVQGVWAKWARQPVPPPEELGEWRYLPRGMLPPGPPTPEGPAAPPKGPSWLGLQARGDQEGAGGGLEAGGGKERKRRQWRRARFFHRGSRSERGGGRSDRRAP